MVGAVLLALAGWWLARGRVGAVTVCVGGLGILLVAVGAAFPRALVVPAALWQRAADALGFVMTRVVLGVVYFLVVTPTGIVRRLLGRDPLGRRSPPGESYWRSYPKRHRDPRHFERMY